MARGGKRIGSGRKLGAVTKRTRAIANQAAASGQTPLEVMLDNMRHFQKVALDAEAVIEAIAQDDFEALGENHETRFKAMLAKVKAAAGLRQMAQECASDAAPFIHARLAAINHTGEITLKRAEQVSDDELANIASGSSEGTAEAPIDKAQLN